MFVRVRMGKGSGERKTRRVGSRRGRRKRHINDSAFGKRKRNIVSRGPDLGAENKKIGVIGA